MFNGIESQFRTKITWLKQMLVGDDGLLSKSRYFQTLPGHHEKSAERFIAVAQVLLVFLIAAVQVFGGRQMGLDTAGTIGLASIGVIALSSLTRWHIAANRNLPDLKLDTLTFVDAAAVTALIGSALYGAAGSEANLSAEPLAIGLAALVAIRMVRAHPRPVLTAGIAGAASLVVSTNLAIIPLNLSNEVFFGFAFLVASLTCGAWFSRRSLRRLNATLENMPHGVALFDDQHRLVVSNTQYSALYDLSDTHRAPGTSITELIRYRYDNGCFGDVDFDSHSADWMENFVDSESEFQELENGRVYAIRRQYDVDGCIVTTTEDVTKQRRLEANFEHLAHHDPLTGLANRVHLRERLEKILQNQRKPDGVTALCMDLDQFKEINDTLGHHVGDDLLVAVADRLRDCVRDGDIIARTGGDEFVILQLGECSQIRAGMLAQRIVDRLTAPFELHGHLVLIGVSIGIAFPDEDCTDAECLIKNADIALYRAKEGGRGTYCFFEESMSARMQERRSLERDLRKALRNGEFELHYQPIMSAENGTIESIEALIRWRHPEKGLLPPGHFIQVVDEIGLAVPMGNWVITQACKDAVSLPEHIKVSVNVSAAHFHKDGLAQTVADALRSAGLAAGRLELEITETVLLENSKMTINTLKELHELGVHIALDDFGTGYSSLSYLQKFSFDRIKIDRSFVSAAETEGSSREIIKTVINLGQRLGMAITAEGVETYEQLDWVTSDGCTAIQGYLISRPLTLFDLSQFLTSRTDNEAVQLNEAV